MLVTTNCTIFTQQSKTKNITRKNCTEPTVSAYLQYKAYNFWHAFDKGFVGTDKLMQLPTDDLVSGIEQKTSQSMPL